MDYRGQKSKVEIFGDSNLLILKIKIITNVSKTLKTRHES